MLLSELNKDLSNIESAIRLANQASSLTVQRKGAQASIPTRKVEEQNIINKNILRLAMKKSMTIDFFIAIL